MNRVILMGRLTRDPEVRYSQGERSMAIARYTLAVDRRGRRNQDNGEQSADFINCVAFDRAGEFAEKYFRQGMRVLVSGRLQTGSYVNKDGQKVYTTEVILDDQEMCIRDRWNIAKKFHTTVGNIISTNELADDKVKGGMRLLLVKEIAQP